MTNPEWTYNLLSRSESVLDFLAHQTTESGRKLTELGKQYFQGDDDASCETIADEADDESLVVRHAPLYKTTGHCVIVNLVEGCAVGGAISLAVSIIPPLLKGKVRQAFKSIFTRYNFRVSIFMGSFMALYNTGVHYQKTHRSVAGQRRLRIILSLLSGFTVSILPIGVRRFLVYLLFTRSLEVLARMSRTQTNKTLEDTFSSHEAVGLTVGSMAVITTTWFGWPELVPKGYLHFLDNISNIEKRRFHDIGHVLLNRVPPNRPDLHAVIASGQPCLAFHDKSEPCLRFAPRVTAMSLVTRTIPFYLKIYQIPLLFQLVKKRGKISPKLVKHFVYRLWWSGLFLSVLSGLVAVGACSVSNQHVVPHWTMMPLCGALAGTALYVEQAGRRLELALYMFGQAVQMSVNVWTHNGLWSPPGLTVAVSASSIALLTQAFAAQHDLSLDSENGHIILRPAYCELLGKILDTSGKRHSFKLFKSLGN